MEYGQTWGCAGPEPVYNPSSSMSVSSYFARPSKIVKSGSRNGSPKMVGRRRTLTAGIPASRTRSVVDNLRVNGHQWQNTTTHNTRSRPLSWHPSCFDHPNPTADQTFDPSATADVPYYNFTTQVNGLITPMSFPVVNAPHIPETMTPLSGQCDQDSPYFSHSHRYTENEPDAMHFKVEPSTLNMMYQPEKQYPYWPQSGPVAVTNVQTAPSSPYCGPQPTTAFEAPALNMTSLSNTQESEELVGMGLYDSPADVQSSSLLFNNVSFAGRKALKLEESFVPVEKYDEEEDEEEDAESEDQERWSEDETASDMPNFKGSLLSQPAAPEPEVETMADRYLATMKQLSSLNNSYYGMAPAQPGYSGYGWI